MTTQHPDIAYPLYPEKGTMVKNVGDGCPIFVRVEWDREVGYNVIIKKKVNGITYIPLKDPMEEIPFKDVTELINHYRTK